MMTVYLCQDTITGIYSALYDAWLEKRAGEAKIALHGNMERSCSASTAKWRKSKRKQRR